MPFPVPNNYKRNVQLSRMEAAVYELWSAGEISDRTAAAFFGDDWADVQQLARVQEILASQPELDATNDDLFS